MIRVPELLLPAGSLKHVRYAFGYGADAVYAGQPRYSLRVRNNDFSLETLAEGIDEAHSLGRRFFVASNILAHNAKVKTYLADMVPIMEMAPDALIMADPGLIHLVRERWPETPIHLSVQANTVNFAAVKFWQSMGLRRVILSRELSLDEMAEIRGQCPDIELEVFVHGSLCIAYSGRCLLSGYFNHRDPNQGACTNACRWSYGLHCDPQDGPVAAASASAASPRHPWADAVYLLEEGQRPGEHFPVSEDEHGTYILNSRDLRAVQHVARLVELGIDSLKIEGRTKSFFYAARTAQVYRQAIDDARAGRSFDPQLLRRLDGLASRGYTDGFYQRHAHSARQNYLHGASQPGREQFVGEVTGYDSARGMLEVLAKNKFAAGDGLELLLPRGGCRVHADRVETIDGTALTEVPGGGYQVRLPMPPADYSYGLLIKYLDTPVDSHLSVAP